MDMEDSKYCRACLAVDVKMYSFSSMLNISIGEIYSQLVQLPVIYEGNQHVCFECARLLHKYHKFKSKCHRAHNILSRIEVDTRQITKLDIQNVNRKEHRLETSLTFSQFVTYYKPSDSLDNDEIKQIKLIEFQEIEIKNEDEINDTDVFDESFNETLNNDSSKESIIKRTKRKSITIKEEPRPKKLKVSREISESNDNLSDDETLSKCENKEKINDKKENDVNKSYFEGYANVMFLTPEDARRELLLRKESSNYKKSLFKCDKCYRGYEAKAAFENHMKKHSIEYGEFECDLCQLWFPKKVSLCKHRLSTHKTKYSCKLCPYICYCPYQAKTHVSLHKGKQYPCKDCGEIFSMPNSLLMHKRMKHLKESVGESVCEHCGDCFLTPRGLFIHNMKLHRQAKNDKQGPECHECGVHFTSELAWKRHLVVSNKHKVSNGCKTCGETFSNTEELKSHMRVHLPKHRNRTDKIKLPVACDICDKWFMKRVEYKTHMTSEHPQSAEAKKFNAEDETPFVCEVCGQMFKQQCFLLYHQRKHTGERPYKCVECGKSFPLAGALSIHSSVHSRKRKHKCDMCGRVFTFKSALNTHIKAAHLNERPHECHLCEKRFVFMSDLKTHIRHSHDKVPYPKKRPNDPHTAKRQRNKREIETL